LGHRKEIFKPRKSKSKTAPLIQSKLEEKKFDEAIQVTLSNYLDKGASDAFAISLLATAEAIVLAKENNWIRPIEEYVLNGIKNAEIKIDTKLNRFRREIIFELVTNSLRKEYRVEGST
jgi:hypothetical protein